MKSLLSLLETYELIEETDKYYVFKGNNFPRIYVEKIIKYLYVDDVVLIEGETYRIYELIVDGLIEGIRLLNIKNNTLRIFHLSNSELNKLSVINKRKMNIKNILK